MLAEFWRKCKCSIVGDLNARVGNEVVEVVGRYGVPGRNEK